MKLKRRGQFMGDCGAPAPKKTTAGVPLGKETMRVKNIEQCWVNGQPIMEEGSGSVRDPLEESFSQGFPSATKNAGMASQSRGMSEDLSGLTQDHSHSGFSQEAGPSSALHRPKSKLDRVVGPKSKAPVAVTELKKSGSHKSNPDSLQSSQKSIYRSPTHQKTSESKGRHSQV